MKEPASRNLDSRASDADPESPLRAAVVAMAAGDQAALANLYDATVGRVYGVALRVTRNAQTAEEVVSDTYFQAWRDASRYNVERGKVLAWLLVICRSRALDALRRQDQAVSHPEPQELVDTAQSEGTASDPYELLAATRGEQGLHEALKELSALQRQLIALAFLKGLSHSEIQVHTGLPLGSVKTHIRKAIAVLRKALGDNAAATGRRTAPKG